MATIIGVEAVTAATVLVMAAYALTRAWCGLLSGTRRVTSEDSQHQRPPAAVAPLRGPRPRDIISHTRTPTTPGADGTAFQARALAFGLGLESVQFKSGVTLILNLFRLYADKDCSLAEINPLVVT